MQVQRVQNNQTSFQALKGFECGKIYYFEYLLLALA